MAVQKCINNIMLWFHVVKTVAYKLKNKFEVNIRLCLRSKDILTFEIIHT